VWTTARVTRSVGVGVGRGVGTGRGRLLAGAARTVWLVVAGAALVMLGGGELVRGVAAAMVCEPQAVSSSRPAVAGSSRRLTCR
jgi:hypothetical protein